MTGEKFQPTLPVREVTKRELRQVQELEISTHTSREGSDLSTSSCVRSYTKFQPTLPVREVTETSAGFSEMSCISTHTSREGSDAIVRVYMFNLIGFQPTLPVREVTTQNKETVRKIRKNSVENTARNLSICDNLAAGVFFRILAGKKTIFKRKRHVSGQNHLH